MSKYSDILIVEGSTLPDPSEMTQSDYDISDSERNAKGIMVAQMIREDVHKIECKWKLLRPSDYERIRSAIKKKFNLNVTYFIADTGQRGSLAMYVGDRKTPIYTYEDGKPVYKNFSVNFIEM
jgi:hypothetical protein